MIINAEVAPGKRANKTNANTKKIARLLHFHLLLFFAFLFSQIWLFDGWSCMAAIAQHNCSCWDSHLLWRHMLPTNTKWVIWWFQLLFLERWWTSRTPTLQSEREPIILDSFGLRSQWAWRCMGWRQFCVPTYPKQFCHVAFSQRWRNQESLVSNQLLHGLPWRRSPRAIYVWHANVRPAFGCRAGARG